MSADFTIEYRDPRTLAAHPRNWRTHPDRQRAALAGSIADHGWLSAPIFNRRTGRLVDGHARIEQAINVGADTVPTRVIDVPEEEEERILASFDRIGELRERDDNLLTSLLSGLADTDAGLPHGWDEGELDALLAGSPDGVNFREFDAAAFDGVEGEWTDIKFRVPLGAVPVIEGQMERVCEVCGIEEKAKGLALERLAILAATIDDAELRGE